MVISYYSGNATDCVNNEKELFFPKIVQDMRQRLKKKYKQCLGCVYVCIMPDCSIERYYNKTNE